MFGTAGLIAASAWRGRADGSKPGPKPLDLHVHLDNSDIDTVARLGAERGVKFGIVEHAGTRENVYPVVLGNDEELRAYLRKLEGHDVYCGVQAEWIDWMSVFSKAALAELDYVLTDTMTFPGKDGRRVKLWEPSAAERVDLDDPQAFMDRYVDWHLQILQSEPIDLLANVSWLPERFAADYEALWTDARIRKVVEAASKLGVAIEISSSYELPKRRFLDQARAAGLKFTFGSNGRYPKMGLLDYSRKMAEALNLGESDMFVPGSCEKAVLRRSW